MWVGETVKGTSHEPTLPSTKSSALWACATYSTFLAESTRTWAFQDYQSLTFLLTLFWTKEERESRLYL